MSPAHQPPNVPRRVLSSVALAGAVAAVLTVATVFSRYFFERPLARPAAPILKGRPILGQPDGGQPNLFRVAAIEGRVLVLYRGQWSLVAAGDYLSLQSELRTAGESRAMLRRAGAEIEVRENVQIRLGELADQTARIDMVSGGQLRAAVAEAGQIVEIGAEQTATRNLGGPARWVVSVGTRGRVHVAAGAGKVGFTAQGRQVTVHTGEESFAPKGSAPSEPRPIPAELLLSVFWPEPRQVAIMSPMVRGKTRPSSQVRINGTPVPVDDDGRFAAQVPLQVGDNPLSVEAQDIDGRRKKVEAVIKRDAQAPLLEPAREDLWKP
jgi:hypothetical protein